MATKSPHDSLPAVEERPVAAPVLGRGAALPIIARAGLLCGVMDITSAFVNWGRKGVLPFRILQGIASGALGPRSFEGGWTTAALGLGFHFLIAFTAATVFYLASRKLRFMTKKPFLVGILYGVAVYGFMYWIVIPLSAIRQGPFSLSATLTAIIVHMLCVGMPISLVVGHNSQMQPAGF
jgi:uncharacterized membrane protein YagU involved in acid resistance